MLAVKDIMQTDVVTVTPDTTARHLARLLADEEISGVPVLDSQGCLAGVVSSTDLVRLAAEETSAEVMRAPDFELAAEKDVDQDAEDEPAERPDPYGFFMPEDSLHSGQRFLDQWVDSEFDAVLVRDIMTPVSFTVEPTTTLPALCELLVRSRIHRAVVVDGGDLLGIVTSADVLRAVAERRVGSME